MDLATHPHAFNSDIKQTSMILRKTKINVHGRLGFWKSELEEKCLHGSLCKASLSSETLPTFFPEPPSSPAKGPPSWLQACHTLSQRLSNQAPDGVKAAAQPSERQQALVETEASLGRGQQPQAALVADVRQKSLRSFSSHSIFWFGGRGAGEPKCVDLNLLFTESM